MVCCSFGGFVGVLSVVVMVVLVSCLYVVGWVLGGEVGRKESLKTWVWEEREIWVVRAKRL
jgi:hypothetical protein